MNCDICGKNPAQIQLEQRGQGEVRTLNLCLSCAREKGIEAHEGKLEFNLSDLIEKLGLKEKNLSHCPGCDISVEELKKEKRAGCPLCYGFFRQEIKEIYKKNYGAFLTYKGEIEEKSLKMAEKVQSIEEELKQAVLEERYEDAARLRDEIRRMRGGSGW